MIAVQNLQFYVFLSQNSRLLLALSIARFLPSQKDKTLKDDEDQALHKTKMSQKSCLRGKWGGEGEVKC